MSTFDFTANAGNHVIVGTTGDDIIIAGPEDEQHNGDKLIQDNDKITGGLGNDTMSGGYGNDDFIFNFQVTSSSSDPVDLSELTSVVVDGVTYERPAMNASIQAWKNWNAALEAYVESVGGVVVKTAFTNTNPGKGGKTVEEIQLVTGYLPAGGGLSIQGEGHDLITDFVHNSVAKENDELVFNGLSDDPAAANYWGNFLTSEHVGGDTVIYFAGGSITLQGIHAELGQMVADGWVVFG